MNFKDLFKSAGNDLEVHEIDETAHAPEITYTCPKCGTVNKKRDLRANFYCCPVCNYYMRISARLRLRLLVDKNSFVEHDRDVTSTNLLGFPEYDQKLAKAMQKSGENEGILTGHATVGGYPCCVFTMHPDFMMGSMGTVLGDKLTRLFEYATENRLPVIGFTVSGGARMQEGMLSLVQMAKVSGAIKRHSDAGNLYIPILTNPTTGGVTASFAMLGDIILAEPGALIGFAGPRVVEQTTRKKLPDGFQKAEYLLDCGFLDDIVSRSQCRPYICRLLMFHQKSRRRSG